MDKASFASSAHSLSPIPIPVGVGLKSQHYQTILDEKPALGWFEVHPENYMCAGGPPHRYLSAIREDYDLSLHSVGTSLGSVSRPDARHLNALKALVERYEPFLVSDHISWSRGPMYYHTDLLPLPYSQEALDVLVRNVGIMQDHLRRQVLLENPSTYLEFAHADMDEPEFLTELVKRAGCGLIMDVNNVFVCAANHGLDGDDYLARVPWDAVQEIHLAGHAVEERDGFELRIDDHGSQVSTDVWALYEKAIGYKGTVPTLIEWDSNIPDFPVLMVEAEKARTVLDV